MSTVLKLLNQQHVIDYSQVFIKNSKVHVQSGPLIGQEEIIKKIDFRKNRAKVSLPFLGGEKIVDLGIEVIGREST
ncbi:hypothetical protein D3C84_1144960 [compost metagenome]